MKKTAATIYILIIVFFVLIFIFNRINIKTKNDTVTEVEKGGYEQALKNYKKDIDVISKQQGIPSSYLMALIMLECSGRKNVPPRFENSVYEKLVQVKNKDLDHFETITSNDLADMTDDDLKDLSKSYGPFQLMGYKSIHLGIKLSDLKGKNCLTYSVIWIKQTYGKYLKKKKYKDAFHIHNAGEEYPDFGAPQTHDPNYVENGLKYMEYFEKLEKIENKYDNGLKTQKK